MRVNDFERETMKTSAPWVLVPALLIVLLGCPVSRPVWNPGDPTLDTRVRMDMLRLMVPKDDFLKGWFRQGEPVLAAGDDVRDLLKDAWIHFMQFSPIAGVFQDFTNETDRLELSIIDMGEASGSFGAFSSMRMRSGKSFKIGKGSFLEDDEFVFWESCFVVRIYGGNRFTALKDQAIFLGRYVHARIKEFVQEDIPPPLASYLPDRGRVPYTALYFRSTIPFPELSPFFREEWLELNSKTEGILVDYLLKNEKAFLLLIQYPSAKKASHAFHTLKAQTKRGEEAQSLTFSRVDSFFSPSSGSRRDSFLFFARGRFLAGILGFNRLETGEALAKELDLLLAGLGE